MAGDNDQKNHGSKKTLALLQRKKLFCWVAARVGLSLRKVH